MAALKCWAAEVESSRKWKVKYNYLKIVLKCSNFSKFTSLLSTKLHTFGGKQLREVVSAAQSFQRHFHLLL